MMVLMLFSLSIHNVILLCGHKMFTKPIQRKGVDQNIALIYMDYEFWHVYRMSKDVFNNLITKSTLKAKEGNNVYAFYTNAFKTGHYTISIYHNNQLIAETKQTIL